MRRYALYRVPVLVFFSFRAPGIALDMASIFEEHHVCLDSSQLFSEQFCNAGRIYVRDKNQFIFNRVLVGRAAQARFKLTNKSNVPCVLSLAIKSVGAKVSYIKGPITAPMGRVLIVLHGAKHLNTSVPDVPQCGGF